MCEVVRGSISEVELAVILEFSILLTSESPALGFSTVLLLRYMAVILVPGAATTILL